MKRQVIQQGPSSLMVSLPSKWAKENGIKKGNEINVEVVNNQLVIYSEEIPNKSELELTINSSSEYLDRMIMVPYREGFNSLIIYYKDPKVLEKIRETLKYLLGFEIVDQTANLCKIKNISEGSEENYDVMFRRLFQIMITMSECCLTYAKTKDETARLSAIDLRETLIKLEQFNLRLLSKQNNFSTHNKQLEFFYVWNIGAFGKMWSSMARKSLNDKIVLSKDDLKFFEHVVSYTNQLYITFYKRDFEKFRVEKEKLYKMRPEGERLLYESTNKKIIFYLMRIMNRIYEVYLTF